MDEKLLEYANIKGGLSCTASWRTSSGNHGNYWVGCGDYPTRCRQRLGEGKCSSDECIYYYDEGWVISFEQWGQVLPRSGAVLLGHNPLKRKRGESEDSADTRSQKQVCVERDSVFRERSIFTLFAQSIEPRIIIRYTDSRIEKEIEDIVANLRFWPRSKVQLFRDAFRRALLLATHPLCSEWLNVFCSTDLILDNANPLEIKVTERFLGSTTARKTWEREFRQLCNCCEFLEKIHLSLYGPQVLKIGLCLNLHSLNCILVHFWTFDFTLISDYEENYVAQYHIIVHYAYVTEECCILLPIGLSVTTWLTVCSVIAWVDFSTNETGWY